MANVMVIHTLMWALSLGLALVHVARGLGVDSKVDQLDADDAPAIFADANLVAQEVARERKKLAAQRLPKSLANDAAPKQKKAEREAADPGMYKKEAEHPKKAPEAPLEELPLPGPPKTAQGRASMAHGEKGSQPGLLDLKPSKENVTAMRKEHQLVQPQRLMRAEVADARLRAKTKQDSSTLPPCAADVVLIDLVEYNCSCFASGDTNGTAGKMGEAECYRMQVCDKGANTPQWARCRRAPQRTCDPVNNLADCLCGREPLNVCKRNYNCDFDTGLCTADVIGSTFSQMTIMFTEGQRCEGTPDGQGSGITAFGGLSANSEEACKYACKAEPTCKFAVWEIGADPGQCSGYSTCDQLVTMSGKQFKVWRRETAHK